ncbi:MAG TPA: SpoIVB peptidase S55 domain-containing protein [Thermoanaerobaculia bacterium]
MRKLVAASLFVIATGTAAAAAAQEPQLPAGILTVDEIRPGMKGWGFSDMGDGRGIERFEVEVLGLLKRFAPRQDLILARVSGAGLEHSGIIAGMSGSPIYVDGKLIGALAYGWPFSKDPICGITPIQSMLDIRQAPAAPPVPIGGAAVSTEALREAFTTGSFRPPMEQLFEALAGPQVEGMSALPLPVSFSGLGGLSPLFEKLSRRAGWMSAPSGSAASKPEAAATPRPSLQPGSAVGTVLMSGDMSLAATGTVTWVEGDGVLAFGHQFLSMGPVSMPMTEAEVLTVLPSVYRSLKFAGAGAVLGSVTQDRSTGIFGTFGTRATMVPVTVRMTSEGLPAQTFRFEVVHNSMLTPILAAVAIDNVLTTLEKRTGERTLFWKSKIATPGRDVQWNSVFTGLAAREEAVASLAVLANFLMANEFRDVSILGFDIEIAHSDRLQSARIVDVEPQKDRVRPGETVPVRVDLVDFRGSPRRVMLDLKIPEGTPAGPLNVFVGDGNAATAYDLSVYPSNPQSLEQVLDFLGRIRPANTLNLLSYRRAPGAVVAGEPLAGLPPSVAAIVRDRGPGESQPELSWLRLQSESIEQPVPVRGSARLRLEVLPRIS